jgi:cyclohexa-1,5-dienecarbonyl-CoA hydratase
MELAAGCDIVLAGNGSRFGQPEIKLGCYPPLAAALYPSLLGPSRTFDLLVTGRSLDCQEAEKIGFVTRRVEEAAFESELQALQSAVTSQSLAVSRLAKRAIRAGIERPFSEALAECERLYLEDLTATLDMQEGLAAFLEKRRPDWKHR